MKENSKGYLATILSVALVALVLYPLSLGPIMRLYNHDLLPEWVGYLYVPLVLLLELTWEPIPSAFESYLDLWLQ